eukprot:COSAG06_NODE_38328_length_424_cov_14.910769_1_plen_66_part_01
MIAVGLGADIESEVKKRVPFFLPFFRSRSTMDIDGLPRQARERRTEGTIETGGVSSDRKQGRDRES